MIKTENIPLSIDQKKNIITKAVEKQHGKDVANGLWISIEGRERYFETIESVEKTVKTVEAVLDGDAKTIDQRSVEIIVNVSSELRHSFEFIKGIIKIYKNSDKETQSALLKAKFEILRKYTFCGELEQKTEHLDALEALDDGGIAYKSVFEELRDKIKQLAVGLGERSEMDILRGFEYQLIKRMQIAMKLCYTKHATILALITLMIIILLGYSIH